MKNDIRISQALNALEIYRRAIYRTVGTGDNARLMLYQSRAAYYYAKARDLANGSWDIWHPAR